MLDEPTIRSSPHLLIAQRAMQSTAVTIKQRASAPVGRGRLTFIGWLTLAAQTNSPPFLLR